MSNNPKIYEYKNLRNVVTRLRDDLNNHDCILIFAHNGTGKTRLSMEFKDVAKQKKGANTLYFNAFTEDLFSWDNDLNGDADRYLQINSESKFFEGLRELALEEKIFSFLEKFANFNFRIDYDEWRISFYRENENNIKISRGEENIFVWCLFLSIYQLVIDGHGAYAWVENIYIDDPVSSLDDNNIIAIAVDLAKLIKESKDKVKVIISTHHTLFHNVMWNEIKNSGMKKQSYYYHQRAEDEKYTLQKTGDTPYFHHVSMLVGLKKAVDTGEIYTYHFNMLRSIMEKTAVFFGFDKFQVCLNGMEDEALLHRSVQLLSHGKYSIYDPVEMLDDNKKLLKLLLENFLNKYEFALPEILKAENS